MAKKSASGGTNPAARIFQKPIVDLTMEDIYQLVSSTKGESGNSKPKPVKTYGPAKEKNKRR